jgi:Tfp pilus assembly protein PilE
LRRGFTLAELLVSLFLVSVSVLSVVAMGISTLRAQQKDTDRPLGTLAAERVLNERIYAVQSDTLANRNAWWATDHSASPWLVGNLTVNQTEYDYNLYTTTISDTAGVKLGSGNPSFNGLKKVDVVVTWWNGSKGQTGYGQMQVTKTALVNRSGY